MVRPRPRRRQSIVWTPFSGGNMNGDGRFYESKNFLRMVMLACILAVYYIFRSWWYYMPVTSLKQREFFDSQGVRRIKKLSVEHEQRFMSSILKKPPPIPRSGFKIMDSFIASKLVAAQSNRYRVIKELDFCQSLNGAVVDTFTPLHFSSADTRMELKPLASRAAHLIDTTAANTYRLILDHYADVDQAEAQRYACYISIEGSNPNTNLSDSRYLVKIPAKHYFEHTLPNMNPSPSIIDGPRRKYKLAYLVTLQELHGFHQLKLLLSILDDGHGIFLIHVSKNDEKLFDLISSYIKERDPKGVGNIFLARNRYHNIPGHINQVFLELTGFWELLDLADWDYVINLSNYDWPLRHNQDIHKILMKNPGYSYLDMIKDTSPIMAKRLRPHLGNKENERNVHSPELGIGVWPFPNCEVFHSSQYMILTRQVVEFLRGDEFGFNLLAFLEHCDNPEEIFFSTVLGNSLSQSPWIIQDKKRYSRDIFSGLWIGWNDRELFPPGSSNPNYLFFGPFNAFGDFFGEGKLKDWVQENHLDRSLVIQCTPNELGQKDECIQDLVSEFSNERDELVVIPVLKDFYHLAANLRCSLNRLGIFNILHWALDSKTHKKLIEDDLLSYYDPKLPPQVSLSYLHSNDAFKSTYYHYRAHFIKKLLNAGFNLWFLDSDSVASRDFRDRALPVNADIMLSMAESKLIRPTSNSATLSSPPSPDFGMMYIRNSERSIDFFGKIVDILDSNNKLNGKEGMQQALSYDPVLWTGIGSKARTLVYEDQLVSSKVDDSIPIKERSEEDNSSFMNNFVDFFNFYASQDETDKMLRVHYFDQFEFINGRVIFENPEIIPQDFKGYRLIHADVEKDPEKAFTAYNLWFLDESMQCKESFAIPNDQKKSD